MHVFRVWCSCFIEDVWMLFEWCLDIVRVLFTYCADRLRVQCGCCSGVV